jgi:hypothetical protein
VPGRHWRECVAQLGRRIAHTGHGGDAVAEHLAAGILEPVRRLDRATRHHPPQARQQLRRLYLGDRASAPPRESILLEAHACALGMAIAHLRLVHGGEPIAGSMLERARAGQSSIGKPGRLGLCRPRLLVRLAGFARVGANRDQLARLVATLPRLT